MRKFVVNVNGKSYEVEVEEIGGAVSAPAAAPVVSAPAVSETPKAAPAPAAAPAGATAVNSPMPGTIMSITVKPGDSVKAGDVLCILESMKMENEIVAPKDATVASVNVNQGQSVNSGDLLVSLS
ncbi:MAG: biotin/lipoyl-containing protein [Clostridia bacterium]|nr:biotin/lipoyl-containing protein [Clostridia bacterium]